MTSALLPANLVFRAFTQSGALAPLAGGLLYFYQAGTSTPQAAYSDATGTVPLANPLVLDANGQAPFWLKSGLVYKINLTDASLVQQAGWPIDNVAADQSQGIFSALAAPTGDALIGVQSLLTGGVPRTQDAKNADTLNLADLGVVGDGVTDDSANFLKAITAAAGAALYGRPGAVYRIAASMTLTTSLNLDLCGATIKPVGNILAFNSIFSPAVSTSITGAVNASARVIPFTSVVGVSIGQWVDLYDDANLFPHFWCQVVSIAANNVTVDRPVPVSYLSSALINVYNDAQWRQSFRMANGTIDGGLIASSSNLGTAIRAAGFKSFLVDNLDLVNFNAASAYNSCPVVAVQCLDSVFSNIRVRGFISNFQSMNAYYSRCATFINCDHDGSGFGIGISNSEVGKAIGNKLSGRRNQEFAESTSTHLSVRGIKITGCAEAIVALNNVSDFDSGLKIDDNFWATVKGNTLNNMLRGSAFAGIGINVGGVTNHAKGGIISGNKVTNCGYALNLGDITQWEIISNHFDTFDFAAINSASNTFILDGNYIANWGINGTTPEAVYNFYGCSASNNRFVHNTQPNFCCFRNAWVAAGQFTFSNNVSPTNNPLWYNSASFTATCSTNVLNVTSISGTPIVVGSLIAGNNVPPGTFVVSLGTGIGGVGTYNLSLSPGTLASQAFVLCPAPTVISGSTATTVLTVTAVVGPQIVVGMQIQGSGLPANTTVTSLGTGTGGAGTYNLSTTPGTIGATTFGGIPPQGIADTAGGNTSIASGATSAIIYHGLLRTPAAEDINCTITNVTTNNTGPAVITGITSTQFTINLRDPGASGATIRWKARIPNPIVT